MIKFKFKLNKQYYITLIAAGVLGVAGLVMNVFNLTRWNEVSVWWGIAYIIMLVLSTALLAFLISLFFRAYYTANDTHVVVYYGFLSTKIKYGAIDEIIFKRKSNKLIINYAGTAFLNISINPPLFGDFVDLIKEKHQGIKYSIDYEDTEKN